MNDNVTEFPSKKKKMTPPPMSFSGDSLASDAAVATAVHMHVFARYLASTGRNTQAEVVLNMAKQIQILGDSIRPSTHQPF